MEQEKNSNASQENQQTADTGSVPETAAAEVAPAEPVSDQGKSTQALLEQAVKTLQEQNLRLQADVDNVRRQSRLEMQKAQKFAIEHFAKSLLPIVDSLELGLQAIKEDQPELASFKEGNRLTLELFYKTFKDFSIESIEPLNEKFDPQWHQAIAQDTTAEAEVNTVVAVLQKGFRLHERLLRPALVKVRV
jgi:molecular chaperone GrpE